MLLWVVHHVRCVGPAAACASLHVASSKLHVQNNEAVWLGWSVWLLLHQFQAAEHLSPYLRRVCTANKAVDHLHGIVDGLKLHKCLMLDCARIQPDANYSAKRLAQLHDFLLSRIWWEVADVQHLQQTRGALESLCSQGVLLLLQLAPLARALAHLARWLVSPEVISVHTHSF